MTNLLASGALAVTSFVGLSIILKATAVLGLTLLATRLARRTRASVRHVLLASAFGVLLTLPAVAMLLPPVAVAIPIVRAVDSGVPQTRAGQHQTFPYALDVSEEDAPPTRQRPARLATLLRIGWGAGALFFLVPVPLALWRLRALRRHGSRWLKGEPTVRSIARHAGIRRPVEILIHEEMMVPVTCGFLRPAIVLPPDAEEWTDTDVRQAIVHELEHVRRGDWPVQLASRLVCALYWFHPLVWIAWRGLCLESERACDDAALNGAERTEYAEQLVTLAERLSNQSLRPVLSMASRSDLSARVAAVLDTDQARGRAGTFRAGVVVAAAGLLAMTISPLRAVSGHQAPVPAAGPTFEVASIKPNKSGDGRVFIQNQPGGRFTATNITLRMLIRQAYQLQEFQISGGPSWLNDDHFDIVAKADASFRDTSAMNVMGSGPTPIQLMIRALLAERFNLMAHNETKDQPIYALVLARSDGRLGPELKKSDTDCAALMAAARGRGGALPPPPQPGQPMPCGLRIGMGNLVAGGASLSQFATSLSMFVGRVVLDKTGLTGTFDISLNWTPDQMPQRPPGVPEPPIDPDGPSIYTAVQEQLGLKLDSARGPVDVLVIDRAEHPTPD